MSETHFGTAPRRLSWLATDDRSLSNSRDPLPVGLPQGKGIGSLTNNHSTCFERATGKFAHDRGNVAGPGKFNDFTEAVFFGGSPRGPCEEFLRRPGNFPQPGG